MTMKTMRIESLLIVVVVALASLSGVSAQQYMFRVLNTTEHGRPAGEWVVAGSASTSDDGPWTRVGTRFTLRFFAAPFGVVSVSPNGGIWLGADGACCGYGQCVFELAPGTLYPDGCNFNTSYSNMVMPLVMDFDPRRSTTSFYDVLIRRDDLVSVQAHNLPLLDTSKSALEEGEPTFSFRTTLFANGSIVVDYIDIPEALWRDELVYLNRTRAAMAGLRAHEQYDVETRFASEWHTSHNGTYIPRRAVRSNQSVEYCPLGTDLCAWPRISPISGGVRVVVSAIDHGCFSVAWLSFRCVFTPIGASAGAFGAVTSPATYNATMQALECVAPSVAVAARTQLSVQYKVPYQGNNGATHGTTYRDVRISRGDMEFEFVNNTDARVSTPASIRALTSASAVCAQCAVAQRNSLVGRMASFCTLDCAGVWGGSARLDNCTVCSGGTTQHVPNADKDCMGVCFGPWVKSATPSVLATGTRAVAIVDTAPDGRTRCECRAGVNGCPDYSLAETTQPPAAPGMTVIDWYNVLVLSSATALILFAVSQLVLRVVKSRGNDVSSGPAMYAHNVLPILPSDEEDDDDDDEDVSSDVMGIERRSSDAHIALVQ
eukprot:TRINITY_DN51407_c0_g1_i1.p1 TRINITY_DN51407_c0_g1~~TRINITY_DN51407_c0_g1_i1.p1  ORF type:complete len:602 (+),score=217.64 TRINITY_DN51407_c0_g1_i1:3-1808(+)